MTSSNFFKHPSTCDKCGQILDYKYFKQTMRCYNCDYFRIPTAVSDIIP